MNSVTARSSFTGTVFGMQATPVKPPAAAARVPVSMVSFHSWPGSRRCACMSTNPGATTSPFAEITRASPAGRSLSILAIAPSSQATSRTASVLVAGSTTRPPLSKSFMRSPSRQQIQDRHADGDPVGDLVQDDRRRPVGDVARQLDAAVDGAGMHDDRVALRAAQPLLRQPELLEVLADRREEPAFLTLQLDAQHHDDVRALEGRVHG